MTTFDVQPHLDVWLGFARLLRWSIATIVAVLVLLAYFLA